jgi:DNA-binding beta-propeller fold protein YncE
LYSRDLFNAGARSDEVSPLQDWRATAILLAGGTILLANCATAQTPAPGLSASPQLPTEAAVRSSISSQAVATAADQASAGSGGSGSPSTALVQGSASGAIQHYEYVVGVSGVYVYDIDNGHQFVRTISLPQLSRGVKGVAASPATGSLYVSYGGDGGQNGNGSLLKYDLLADRLVWTKSYSTGIDSMDVTPDGKKIYLPDGELASDGTWHVIDSASGAITADLHGPKGPHNTVVSLQGDRVYLGGRWDNHLEVADTATNKIVQRIGPLKDTVRPFTVNGKQTLVFTTATGFLGFQVSDIATGRVLYTSGIDGFSFDPHQSSLTAPSHGISLSPDEREVYVIDPPNDYVHVFDVSGLPAAPPSKVADIHLQGRMDNTETPCAYDCEKDGWLQHSRDGRFVYVGDAGDVIDTAKRATVALLAPLANTRKSLEIDFRSGAAVATSSRIGLGYTT